MLREFYAKEKDVFGGRKRFYFASYFESNYYKNENIQMSQVLGLFSEFVSDLNKSRHDIQF